MAGKYDEGMVYLIPGDVLNDLLTADDVTGAEGDIDAEVLADGTVSLSFANTQLVVLPANGFAYAVYVPMRPAAQQPPA